MELVHKQYVYTILNLINGTSSRTTSELLSKLRKIVEQLQFIEGILQ